ncbi:MAG: PDZ domain-containing protein [Clostridia bacterium]|nr:PDZ domain-containing protein [Clostridia bacterium]
MSEENKNNDNLNDFTEADASAENGDMAFSASDDGGREPNPSVDGDDERIESLFGDGTPPQKEKKERKLSLSAFLFSAVALVLAAVMLTYTLCGSYYKKQLAEAKLQNAVVGAEGKYDQLELLGQIFESYSYYDLDEDEMLDKVLKAYVDATGDLYAEYYNAEEYKAMRSETAGESEGIGISVIYSTALINGYEYKTIEVISVTPDSPADEAGLRIGDHIVWAGIGEERELIDSLGYTAAMSELKGKAGTVAKFTVLRENGDEYDELEFSVERKEVESVSVYSSVSEADASVGIVKIAQFDLTAPEQFSEAVDALLKQGCTKFVFDVRYNPGGDLNSIVAVLSYFLDEGDVILSTKDKSGNEEIIKVQPVSYDDEDYKGCNVAKEDIGKYKNIEDIAVLCNDSTASAAELFTAAMRDYELADIVGITTYGKGSMQSILPLTSFGYSGALKLTTKMYFPPCGEGYDGVGIKPDVEVDLSDEAKKYNIYVLPQSLDGQLSAALDCLG